MPPITEDQLNAPMPGGRTLPPPAPRQQRRIIWDQEPAQPTQQPAQPTQRKIVWDDQQASAAPQPSMSDRLFGSRLPGMQKTADRYVAGQISTPEMLASHAASGMGRLADGVIGAVSAVTPQFVKDIGSSAIQMASKLPTIDGGTIGEQVPQELAAISEAHPRLATNVRTGLDLASVLPAAKAVDVTAQLSGKGVTAAVSNFKNSGPLPSYLSDTTSQLLPTTPKLPTATDFAKMSGDSAKLAKEVGGTFSAEQVANKVAAKIDETMPTPITGAKLTKEQKAFMRNLEDYKGIRGKNWTIDDVENMDKTLRSKINTYVAPNGTMSEEGRALTQIQVKLRSALDEIPENSANNALLNMRSNWQAKKILDDLEDVAEQAALRPDPATYIQGRLRTMLADGDRIRGWPKEVIASMKKAAKSGLTDDLLGFFSGRLPAIIAGSTGNIAGAATAAVGRQASILGKQGLVGKRLADVEKAVVGNAMKNQRPVVVPPKTPTVAEQLRLPAPTNPATAGGSYIPPSKQQLTMGERLMSKPPTTEPVSGPAAIATPVSQLTNLSGKLGRGKKVELDNLSRLLIDGDLSTNKFIEGVRQEFGLSVKQARSLASEVKEKGVRGLEVIKAKRTLAQKIDDFIKDEGGAVDLNRVRELLSDLPKGKREQLNRMIEALGAGSVTAGQFENFTKDVFKISGERLRKLNAALNDVPATPITKVHDEFSSYKRVVPTELSDRVIQAGYKERVYEGGANNIKSNHYDVPDYYSHVRYVDSGDTRFLVEVQSDVHGAGKKYTRVPGRAAADEDIEMYDLMEHIENARMRARFDAYEFEDVLDPEEVHLALGDIISSGRAPSVTEFRRMVGSEGTALPRNVIERLIREAVAESVDYASKQGPEFTAKDPKWLRNTLEKAVEEATTEGQQTLRVKIGPQARGLNRSEGVQKWYQDTVEPTLEKIAKERSLPFETSKGTELGYATITLKKGEAK